MKIFFEGYEYPSSLVKSNFTEHYFIEELKEGKIKIPCVGYFYNPKIKDSVFILPKVFIINDKAFGHYDPKNIIEYNSTTCNQAEKTLIYEISVWIYKAVVRYSKRKQSSKITTNEQIQQVFSYKGDDSQTFLDIVIALINFNKKHRNLFTYISKINSSGNNKIHWTKTINKCKPVIHNNIPYYVDFKNKSKIVNFDEEIIVLFYSVLEFLNDKYHFKIDTNLNYNLIPVREIENMITNGKGTRYLRSIRRKYYIDELVQLWKLLFAFFEKSENINNKEKTHKELLLVKNFNIVFEDMIDQLIGDEDVTTKLKKQKDGKIIDHIYKDKSLIDDKSLIYFIGDSKYYKDDAELDKLSIYKQFTYAKNVIQGNIKLLRNELTEGYNITPNFFIRGVVEPDLSMTEQFLIDKLKLTKEYNNIHFENRFFDRDTLLLQEYNINFLFVLSSYVSNSDNQSFKQKIRKIF